MGIFRNKEDYDIHCRDRNLKNIIDEYYKTKEGCYEDRIAFLVQDGIKYRQLLMDCLELEYSKHYSDNTCDIPDYKTFLSVEQEMLDNKDEYRNKTICVEGYVAYHILPNGVFLYPTPCKSDVGKRFFYALADDMRVTDSIILISEELCSLEEGTHIRVYGTPSFYKAWDGGRAAKVHINVQGYEVLD